MHIPNHVLDPGTCAVAAVGSAAVVGYAWQQVRTHATSRDVPLFGVTAACVFAAQMLNYPVAGGTSGHVLGGVLAAVLLGPWAGILAMTVVIAVQCLLFQDGGLYALGANVLNMAVIGSGFGYLMYDNIRQRLGGTRGVLIGAVLASWLSVLAAAALCAVEIGFQPQYRLGPALGAMLSVHALIGLGEALATGAVVALVLRTRPDLIYQPPSAATAGASQASRSVLVVGLAAALLMAVVLSPWASARPDGLEQSLAQLGHQTVPEGESLLATWLSAGGLNLDAAWANSLMGALGLLVTLGVALAVCFGWSQRAAPPLSAATDRPAAR